jgi:hypothetical protein
MPVGRRSDAADLRAWEGDLLMTSKNNVRARIAAAMAAIGVNAARAAAPLLAALPILIFLWAAQAFAQGAANVPVAAAPTPSPSAELLKNWRHGMARVSPPNAGCFTSSYPNPDGSRYSAGMGRRSPLYMAVRWLTR